MIQWAAIADKLDQLYSNQSRPTIALMCGAAVAGSCFIPAVAPIAVPVAGGIVMAYFGAKAVEKNIAAKADVAKTNGTPS
jgi:acetyl-CoA carboxylase carboxyltransferase component